MNVGAQRYPECPRCGFCNRPSGKANNYCISCDDKTSYDYCTPRKQPDIRLSAEMSAEIMKGNPKGAKLGDVLNMTGFDGKLRHYVIVEIKDGCIAGVRLDDGK